MSRTNILTLGIILILGTIAVGMWLGNRDSAEDTASTELIATTSPTPRVGESTPEPTTSPAEVAPVEEQSPGSSDTSLAAPVVVRYTANGFEPAEVRIPLGAEIVFSNESNGSMWVGSDPHPTHTGYAGFDAGRSYRPGESYTFTFTREGRWGYHNHVNPSQKGTVIVE